MARVLLPRRAVRSGPRRGPNLLEAALELAGVAMVVCAADGRLTHANRQARELLAGSSSLGSYPAARMLQLRPRTASGVALPLEDLPSVRALQGEIVKGVDVLVVVAGEDVLLEIDARPASDGRGRTRGAVVTLADVTERRGLERRVRAPGWTPWRSVRD